MTGKIFDFFPDIDDPDIGILPVDQGFKVFRLNQKFRPCISSIGNRQCELA
jgi:hypothetical protein